MARRYFFCIAVLAVAANARPREVRAVEPIRLTNYPENETIRHSVPLLRGELPKGAAALVVINESSQRSTREMKGVVHKGRFLALAELVPGENRLLLKSGAHERRLTLNYKPQANPHVVRMIYLTDNSGDTDYQTQRKNDPQNYAGKLDVAAKLMQSFTAERMHDLGFGRVTFNLELDDGGRVKVHTLRGAHPAAEEYLLRDGDWWGRVAGVVNEKLPDPRAKNVVIAAYTRKDPVTGRVQGHTALGGGNLGLFGSGGLFCWPGGLNEVFAAFSDTTAVDSVRIHDDSVGRSTFWGLLSTTLGATLHELGHTFDLPHSTEPMDIMTRGFDHMNRVFSLIEPPPRGGRNSYAFTDREIACFAPVSAASLKASPWFALDAVDHPPGPPPEVDIDDAGSVLLESPRGIRYVGLMKGGDAIGFRAWWNQEPPQKVALSGGDLEIGGVRATHLRVVDDAGQQTIAEPAAAPQFVRSWKFAPETRPWTPEKGFLRLSEAELKTIAAAAGREKLVRSKAPFVDFAARFPNRTVDVAGYAAREIVLEQPAHLRLRTGSDDALRVWIDGKPVLEIEKLRSAQADEDTATVDVAAGTHTLLVEVSQAGGGWGLYLRLEDEQGARLRLTDDGGLQPLPPAK